MYCLQERKQVLQAAREIWTSGLVSGTWGNVSVRAEHNPWMVITPSGMDYNAMSVEDMVVLDSAAQVIEGKYRPSIETRLHLEIYNNRREVNAVVHVHSLYASAFAVAGMAVPVVLEETAQIIGHEIPVVPYVRCGTIELAQAATEILGKSNKAAILSNHGLIGLGKGIAEALKVCYIVEKTARVVLYARILGRVNSLNSSEIELLSRDFENYGQWK